MAVVFGEIDCLKNLIDILKRSGIEHIKSLDDVIKFKNVCDDKVKEAEAIARQEHHLKLTQQKEMISNHVAEQVNTQENLSYLRKVFRSVVSWFKLFNLRRELKRLERKSEKIIRNKISQMTGSFLTSKYLLDSNYALIQGASGEQQALDELRKLPDSYNVINNVQLRFLKPVYNPRTRQRVYTAQADHVVLGPSGVFLVETKNWSNGTIKRTTNFSAFDQIKRTNFALYCHLNPRTNGFFSFFSEAKKIPVKSVLLMTGQTTGERDSFVKVVSLYELNSYITNCAPVMTELEIKKVLNKLLY
ncbi:MAG: NERD domain-containing protein [Bacteriovoracaceae bacterium]|nr:NERD domain-containing protein [Bacteriovoracaceae bacterium]